MFQYLKKGQKNGKYKYSMVDTHIPGWGIG